MYCKKEMGTRTGHTGESTTFASPHSKSRANFFEKHNPLIIKEIGRDLRCRGSRVDPGGAGQVLIRVRIEPGEAGSAPAEEKSEGRCQ
jgi:hypothetical protein